jgi:hypothetical protein
VSEAFQANDIAGVSAASTEWAGNFKATKYVSNITISAADGHITVFYSATTPQINGKTLVLTPNINKAVLATGAQGNIDWACVSTTSQTAVTTRGLASAAAGTVDSRYVPTECK